MEGSRCKAVAGNARWSRGRRTEPRRDYALPGNQAQFGARRLAQSSIILLQY